MKAFLFVLLGICAFHHAAAKILALPAEAQVIVWQRAGLAGHAVLSLVTSPNGDLLAGTADSGIFMSTDRGSTWRKLPLPLLSISTLAAPDTMNIFAGSTVGISHSSDGGTTWGPLTFTNCFGTTLYSDGQGDVFAGLLDVFDGIGGKVFKTSDMGVEWIRQDPALQNARMICFLRISPSILLAGSASERVYIDKSPPNEWFFYGGLFMSSDSGGHWSKILLDSISVSSLSRTPSNVILAGTAWRGIYRSTDEGQTWIESDSGLYSLNELNIRSLVSNAESRSFAATLAGVYASNDTGLSWQPENAGLTVGGVEVLSLDPDQFLYAATSDGVFRTVNPTAEVSEEGKAIPRGFRLSECYPNPFNPGTAVEFQLPVTSEILLKICDLLGRDVTILKSGQFEPGKYQARWHGETAAGVSASGGVYFVYFLAHSVAKPQERYVQTRRIMLIK